MKVCFLFFFEAVNPWNSGYRLGVRPTWQHICQGSRFHCQYVAPLKSLPVKAQRDDCLQYNYTAHVGKGNDLNV